MRRSGYESRSRCTAEINTDFGTCLSNIPGTRHSGTHALKTATPGRHESLLTIQTSS